MSNKTAIVIGGGTFSHVRNHLSLGVPAFGSTARQIYDLFYQKNRCGDTGIDPSLFLTKMADPLGSDIVTNEDVERLTEVLIEDENVRVIFFNVALCDFTGHIGEEVESGKYAERLKTSRGDDVMMIMPARKLLGRIRKERKDIFLVAFKTTCGATEAEQYEAGLRLLKSNSCNLVLANDTKNRRNMIITPEEARYCVTEDRDEVLRELVEMTVARTKLTFERTRVNETLSTPWSEAPEDFRRVMGHCFAQGAYKPFRGVTVGHFCIRLEGGSMYSSTRKRDHNDVANDGLIFVTPDANNKNILLSYGAGKPSAGARSQYLLLEENPEMDYIVHFHCPLREDARDDIQVQSQREFECGSIECGLNTVKGMKAFNDGRIKAVMLDNHGPNIMFSEDATPEEVIEFIDANFDLSGKTGGVIG